MEIDFSDINISSNGLLYGTITTVTVLVMVVLGWLGQPVTPITDAGGPRLLTLDDWRLLQAQKAYTAELQVLRSDADKLANFLNEKPNPVQVQIDVESIIKHTRSGQPSLQSSRDALAAAAAVVRDWSSGTATRDSAVSSLQSAMNILGQ